MNSLMVAAVFMLAGTVKGVTGMGLPTVAISLLGLWMTPLQAAALLVVPSLMTNLAQCRGPHLQALTRKLWPLWLTMAVFAVWTPDLGDLVPKASAHRLLGIVLLVYGSFGLWRPVLPHCPRPPVCLVAIVGAATGLVIAATAIFVLPLLPFLQTLRLCKEAMVQALGLSFMVATLALAVRTHGSGELLITGPALLALVAAFLGLQAGTRLRTCLSPTGFQRGLSLVLIGLGVANLLRGGMGGV